jgi:osmotically-inducible protein OsmY
LDFDKALEYIVGKKVRKSDRYAQFRAFMRAQIKDPTIDEEKRMAIVTRRFTELKNGGFSLGSYERAGGLFDQWKARQAKEKARKAAAARWGKKSLGGF